VDGCQRRILQTLTIDYRKNIMRGQGPGSLDQKTLRLGEMNLAVCCGSGVSVSIAFPLLVWYAYGQGEAGNGKSVFW
jgi:hypothetical protein